MPDLKDPQEVPVHRIAEATLSGVQPRAVNRAPQDQVTPAEEAREPTPTQIELAKRESELIDRKYFLDKKLANFANENRNGKFSAAHGLNLLSIASILDAVGAWEPDPTERGLIPDDVQFWVGERQYRFVNGEFPEWDQYWKQRRQKNFVLDSLLEEQILARAHEALAAVDSEMNHVRALLAGGR